MEEGFEETGKVRFIIKARTLLIIVSAITGIAARFLNIYYPYRIFIILGIWYGLNLIYKYWLGKQEDNKKFMSRLNFLSLLGDVFIISAIIYFRKEAPVYLFLYYLFPLLCGSIFLELAKSLFMAAMCSLGFITTVVLEYRELIFGMINEATYLKYRLVLGVCSFFLVAFLGNFIARLLGQKGKELLKSRSYTENIIKNMLDSLVVVDQEMRIKTVNPAMLKLLGCKENEILDRPITAILEEDSRSRECLSKLTDEGHVYNCEICCKNKIGELIPVSFSGSIMRDDSGKAMGAVGIGRDIRDARSMAEKEKEHAAEIEHSQQRLITTIESMADGFIVTDENNIVELVNTVAEDIFELNRKDMLNRPLFDFNLSHVSINVLKTKKEKEGIYVKEVSLKNNFTGQAKLYNLHVAPIKNASGEYRGTVVVMRNVTEEREAEYMKDEFVSNVSHELRSPLASIKGFIFTLMSNPGLKKEKKDHFMKIINEESDRLVDLIEDLLDLSRIESGRRELVPEKVSLSEVVKPILSSLSPRAGAKKIHINISVPADLPDVFADEAALKQIMVNLVSNAIKFTPEKGIIDVGAMPARAKKNYVEIYVSDNGAGIDKDEQKKVFEKFYRVEKLAHTIPGTGLGLSIVQELVRMSGGEIRLESEPGKGSKFTFTLPLAR